MRAVKRFESGMVVNPITMTPDQTLADALELMARHKISGIPVTEKDGRLVGILTNRDVRFAENPRQPVAELMTRDNLVTVGPGVTQEEAQAPAPPAADREAAGGRRRPSLHRPDHRQGHREGGHLSRRDQGRRRAAARRRRDHGRRQGLRAQRGADRRRMRPDRDRHRARPQSRRRRRGRADQAQLQRGPGRRRQRRHRARRPRR